MIIPYGSDRDDGFVGYASIGVVVLCLLGFLLTWPAEIRLERSIQVDSLKVWTRQTAEKGPRRKTVHAAEETEKAISPYRLADSLLGALEAPSEPSGPGILAAKVKAAYRAGSPLRRWGLHPGDGPWFPALGTHMFLHAGWSHLIGNMIFFFAFGVAMERRFGIGGFLFLYLAGGIFSALAELGAYEIWHHAGSTVPLVGASGAIAATMGAFLRSYPKAKIKVFIWLLRPRTIRLDAWIFLGLWFAGQLLYSLFLSRGGEGGTAYMAHMGGFLFGVVAAQFVPVDAEVREEERLLRRKSPSALLAGFDPPPARRESSPVDLGWECLRTGSEGEARRHFTRQGAVWVKGSEDDLANLAALVDRLRVRTPPFQFDPLPAWEWGIRLADTLHTATATALLESTLSAQPPLPPTMEQRARETLERIRPAAAVPPPAPRPARPSAPVAPSLRPDGRPGWMTD